MPLLFPPILTVIVFFFFSNSCCKQIRRLFLLSSQLKPHLDSCPLLSYFLNGHMSFNSIRFCNHIIRYTCNTTETNIIKIILFATKKTTVAIWPTFLLVFIFPNDRLFHTHLCLSNCLACQWLINVKTIAISLLGYRICNTIFYFHLLPSFFLLCGVLFCAFKRQSSHTSPYKFFWCLYHP